MKEKDQRAVEGMTALMDTEPYMPIFVARDII